jgi:hypothetical protein
LVPVEGDGDYFEEPPEDVPDECGPLIVPPLAPGEVVPLAPGEVVELCGAELLPDELSQSFIAALSLLLLMPLLLLELGLLVVPLLAPGLLEAEALSPGGQSLLDRPREVPAAPEVAPALLPVDVPLVPALVPDLLSVAPLVLLVCAIAAVPRVSARIEAAVRRRRFIRCPPCEKRRPAGQKAPGALDR